MLAEGEQENAAWWAKIRALDEDSAHQVSHRIVEFAQQHQASVLVCEHLGHFKPQKGKYSKRGNAKRSYWLRGKTFTYTKYKAWNEGILTCRVSPRNTSRDCARCGAPVARYDAGKPAEGYTPGAPLATERSTKVGGPRKWEVFQAPKSPKAKEGSLPTTPGMEQGTRRAPRRIQCSGQRTLYQVLLAHPLRLFNES